MALLGGAAAAWPIGARAQQSAKKPRIGALGLERWSPVVARAFSEGIGQFNSADIAKLVIPLLEDRADFATCSRFADPALRPVMPAVKFHGNRVVTSIINWVCGGTKFTDVSCGFRAYDTIGTTKTTCRSRERGTSLPHKPGGACSPGKGSIRSCSTPTGSAGSPRGQWRVP